MQSTNGVLALLWDGMQLTPGQSKWLLFIPKIWVVKVYIVFV